jgi:DNA-binding IclR family transcriptional regulator
MTDDTHGSGAERYNVPGLQRGLMLLSAFRHDRRTLTGAELAREMKLPRASVFRILQTLEQMGFVERVADTSHYRLGFAVLRLGFEFLASMPLTDQGRPVLQDLSDATGFTSHLAVRDGTEVVFVAKSTGRTSLLSTIQVGARLPAHGTILGRVLLGQHTAQQLSVLFGPGPYPKYTPQTPTTAQALHEQIQADMQGGYAVSQGGYESGICSVAAPVYDEHHAICAAINVTIAAGSITPQQVRDIAPLVTHAAMRLSRRMEQQHPARERHPQESFA